MTQLSLELRLPVSLKASPLCCVSRGRLCRTMILVAVHVSFDGRHHGFFFSNSTKQAKLRAIIEGRCRTYETLYGLFSQYVLFLPNNLQLMVLILTLILTLVSLLIFPPCLYLSDVYGIPERAGVRSALGRVSHYRGEKREGPLRRRV